MPFLRGEVTDNNDPMQRGRVRVKVWGVHKDDDENLPWAEVMGDTADPLHQGKGKKPKKMPIGCTVWVEFEAGDLNCPVVVGVFVGHKAGDDMSAANAGNSDWAMASGGGGGGLGGLLGGTLGALGTEIGGALGGPLGAQIGGMIGQAMGQKIGDTIEGGGGGGGGGGSDGTGTGTGVNAGTTESGQAWYVKDGYIHMGKWSRAVKPSGYAEWAPVITKEAIAAGVPPTDVVAFANIESAFKPNAVNGSHYGLFQMSQEYFPGTKEPMANIRGALKLYKDNKAFWEKKGDGRPWGPGLAYLLHQQGAAGGTKLATSDALASSIVGANAVKSNAGDLSMTGKQYAQMWMDRLNALSAYYGGATSGGRTGSSGSTPTDNSPVPNKARAAAAYAVAHSEKSKPYGDCALYVNNAIRSQGFKASGHGVSVARNLINMNPGKFVSVPYSASYVPKIGDVMSIPANDSDNGPRQRGKYPNMNPLPGHVAIFTESGWVSDFIQGAKYGNTGAANVYYYKGILSGVNPVTIARPLV